MSLLPPNATVQEKALEAALARASALASEARRLWDVATCPVELLPWLAWGVSVTAWDDAWDEAKKRAVIAASIGVHKQKGTPAAIKNALIAMGYYGVKVIEGGEDLPPFQFDVELGVASMPNDNDLATIRARINEFKNERSQLRNISLFSLFRNGFITARDGTYNRTGVVNV
ncbi:MAG: phage tail protein I [Methyloprofundus sp.]|nr:phage tail protein I [Methyloprofundus sp.]